MRKFLITFIALANMSLIDANDCLDNVTPTNGFDYFSGYKGLTYEGMSLSNYPTIWASQSGKQIITVEGVGFKREFDMEDFDKAIEAYKALLTLNGYKPPK